MEDFKCPKCGEPLETGNVHVDKNSTALDTQISCDSEWCKGKRVVYGFLKFSEIIEDDLS